MPKEPRGRARRLAALLGMLTLMLIFPLTLPCYASPAFGLTECELPITASLTLSSDVACTAGGLVVGANGITLDCAGHTVRGTGTQGNSSTHGIEVDRYSDVTVRNCNVTGYVNGSAFFVTGTNDTLVGNTAVNNTGAIAFDLPLFQSTVTNNHALGDETGFIVGGSHDNLTGNVAEGNSDPANGFGFTVIGDNETLVNNTSNRNGQEGFTVEGGSNVLESNSAFFNAEVGFDDIPAAYGQTVNPNTYSGNTCGGNGFSQSNPPGLCLVVAVSSSKTTSSSSTVSSSSELSSSSSSSSTSSVVTSSSAFSSSSTAAPHSTSSEVNSSLSAMTTSEISSAGGSNLTYAYVGGAALVLVLALVFSGMAIARRRSSARPPPAPGP